MTWAPLCHELERHFCGAGSHLADRAGRVQSTGVGRGDCFRGRVISKNRLLGDDGDGVPEAEGGVTLPAPAPSPVP